MNKITLPILIILASVSSGCSGMKFVDENGAVHHLIIGIGVVSTNGNKSSAESINVTKTNVLGFYISNQPGLKVGVGYSSSRTLQIPLDSNVIVEVDEKPMGTVLIETTSNKQETQ